MNDCQMIAELKRRDNVAYNILYTFYYPIVEHFVCRNSGTVDDAKDVFQETLIVLLDKVSQADFELSSSLKTYLYAISSNIWLKKLRTAKKWTGYSDEPSIPDSSANSWEQEEEETAQSMMIQQAFQTVSGHCQMLLIKTFIQESNRESLMKEMGYKNTHSFDNQKYKCLSQARKSKKDNTEGDRKPFPGIKEQ